MAVRLLPDRKSVVCGILLFVVVVLTGEPILGSDKNVVDSLEHEVQALGAKIADLRAYLLTPHPQQEVEATLTLADNIYRRDYILWQISMCHIDPSGPDVEPPVLDLSAAINTYQMFVANYPDVPECADALFNTGQCWMAVARVNNRSELEADTAQMGKAADAFRRLLSEYPGYRDEPDAKVKLAECYRALGYPEKIPVVLSDFISGGDPTLELKALELRAVANYDAGRYLDAILDFEEQASHYHAESPSDATWESPALRNIAHNIAACIERIGGVESFESASKILTGKAYACRIYVELGRIYFEKERWPQTTGCLTGWLARCQSDFDLPDVLSMLSVAYFESGHEQLAKDTRESLKLQCGPNSRRWLIAGAERRDSLHNALEQAFFLPGATYFRAALEAAKDGQLARSLDLHEKALTVFDEYLAAVPENETTQEILYYAGQVACELEFYDRAVAYYRRARDGARHWPHWIAVSDQQDIDVGPQSGFNLLLIQQELIEVANRSLDDSLPDSTVRAQHLKILHQAVITDSDALLSQFPDHASVSDVRRFWAYSSYCLGNYDEAIHLLQEVLPETFDTDTRQHMRLLLGNAYYCMADYVKSEEVALGITTGKYRDLAYELAARAAIMGARKQENSDRYLEVAAKYPMTPQATEALDAAARLLWKALAYDSAASVAEKLMDNSTYYPRLVFYFASDAQGRADWQMARSLYEALIYAYPGDARAAWAHYNLGICLDSLGECREAAHSYNLVADAYPDSSFSHHARFSACRDFAICDSLSDQFIHTLRIFMEETSPFVNMSIRTGQFGESDTVSRELVITINRLLQSAAWAGQWYQFHNFPDSARNTYLWADSLMEQLSSSMGVQLDKWVAANTYSLGCLASQSLMDFPPAPSADVRMWLKEATAVREQALEYLRSVRNAGSLDYTPAAYVAMSETHGLFAHRVFGVVKLQPLSDSLEGWYDLAREVFTGYSRAIHNALECLDLTLPFDTTGTPFIRSRELVADWVDSLVAVYDYLIAATEVPNTDTADLLTLRFVKSVYELRLDVGITFNRLFSDFSDNCRDRILLQPAASAQRGESRSCLQCGLSNIYIADISDRIAKRIFTKVELKESAEVLALHRSEYLAEAERWLSSCLSAENQFIADSARLILDSLK